MNNQWTSRPSLNQKKGGLAGVSLGDKIFAVGGGNGTECFSDVEMLDLDAGRWIPTLSMFHKVTLKYVFYNFGVMYISVSC